MTSNAVSPASAIAYELSKRVQRRMFERLRRDGVLAAAGDDRWFIDIPRYHESVSTRRKRAIGVLRAVILAAAGLALLG